MNCSPSNGEPWNGSGGPEMIFAWCVVTARYLTIAAELSQSHRTVVVCLSNTPLLHNVYALATLRCLKLLQYYQVLL